ncbi:MAG: pitrilysin family protein [Ignavibacteriales bacterium]|nr:pitrilysin family protein [Ignavibacteriales bacterium]
MKNAILYLAVSFIVVILFSQSLIAQRVERNAPPQLPPPSKLVVPPIEKFELSNGIKVVLMEKHNVPLVQLNVIVKSGSICDPENKTGLANLTMDMLDEGAAGKTSLELADAIDFLGARISASAGQHYSGIYLHTPLSKFDDALKLLSDIVLNPDFPLKELERKTKDRLTTIMQWHDQPTAIAPFTFNLKLFGKEHPYGRPTIGYENTIKSFSVGDLKNFHKEYFKANNAFIVAVGDVKIDELKTKLESAFGKWQKGDVPTDKIKEALQVNKRTIYIVDKPGSAQSVIFIGRIGAPRITTDYNAISVMNTILGGSFSSRLNQNLREVHGYTYGAGSYFSFRPIPGPFIAQSSVQTDVTDKALTEFFNELNGILKPVPDEELARAKNYLALSYPSNFQNVAEIAGQLEEMVEYNLPDNYFSDYIPSVLSISGDDVNKAAKKYIVPDQVLVVVVGDKAKIEDGIKKLNLGEIINLSIEDVLGKIPKIEN